uniref:Uncharacterized protein n=1 Tax=Dulem virus 32 TaxID=3145750 RepID=A0AAU8B1A3_9CAUD
MILAEAPLLPPWEVWAGMLGGAAALLTAIFGGVKILAEVRALRAKADDTAATAEAVLHEQRPNSGGSMRDAINRTEVGMQVLIGKVEALEQAGERRDRELKRSNDLHASTLERLTLDERRSETRHESHEQRLQALETLAISKEIQP